MTFITSYARIINCSVRTNYSERIGRSRNLKELEMKLLQKFILWARTNAVEERLDRQPDNKELREKLIRLRRAQNALG